MPATYIYTGGKSPFEDIAAYAEKVRQRFPGITDAGVSRAVKRSLGLLRPRQKAMIVAFYGRDILTEDLDGAGFWPLLAQRQRDRLAAHPVEGGIAFSEDMDAKTRLALLHDRSYHRINRSVLVAARDGRMMAQTYVFSQQTGWEQQIGDEDAEILLSYPQIRALLVREDAFLGYRPIRSYSHIPIRETFAINTTRDIPAAMAHMQRTGAVPGVDIPKERT